MFLKLCKHELKCSYRSFLFLYAVLIVVALFLNPNGQSMFNNIAIIIYSIVLMVLFVMCIVVIIKNYNTSMFTRSAYLTHTLPVSTTALLLTKILSAIFWSIISTIVVLISILLISFRMTGFDIGYVQSMISDIIQSPNIWSTLLMIVFLLFSLIEAITLIYLAINITHTTHIQRFRPAIAFLFFIMISWFVQLVTLLVNKAFFSTEFHFLLSASFDSNTAIINTIHIDGSELTKLLLIQICISIVWTVIYFFVSKYILDHKLEIE